MGESLFSKVEKKFAAIYNSFNVDFEPHLSANFERCYQIKTILNRAEPINLLSIYVNTNFEQDLSTIEDYYLIDNLYKLGRLCIIGRGGDGKTVFMKYLWLSLFNNPQGKIPIFVELRRINDFQSDDLLAYIFRSIVDVRSRITQEYFNEAVHHGLFVFLLDGFDEISREKKDSVERQILNLSHLHPRAVIVVSGRLDGRFDSWQAFTPFRVLPLSKKQTVELIEKISYDKVTKRRFVARVKKDLYDKHPSFLSSPLLTTMMLLTFDQFADIPEKIYIFFDQAFDTLYLRHDATKEGFQRKKYTDLPIDRFKRYFSYFCLISYYDEKIEFTDTEFRGYVEKAFKANDAKVETDMFIRDVIESICIMQKEGLNYFFTHRSFQEYFAAYCLAHYIEARFEDISMHLVGRPNDTVIAMLLDMQRDKAEAKFVIPALSKNLEKARVKSCHKSYLSFIYHYECSIRSNRIDKRDRLFVHSQNKDHDLFNLLLKLYPTYAFSIEEFKQFQDADVKILRYLRKKHGLFSSKITRMFFEEHANDVEIDLENASLSLDELEGSGYARYNIELFARMEKLCAALKKRHAAANQSIDEILNLT